MRTTDQELDPKSEMAKNVGLYPWFKFFQNLVSWQAVWFLYFQCELSASEAILLYAVYDVATTVLKVPSGYLSDRLGRRITLIAAAIAGFAGAGSSRSAAALPFLRWDRSLLVRRPPLHQEPITPC
ncbi:MAG: hypothetical protein ACR2PF_16830 [Rhizobiaceae bacterium]